MIRLLVDSASDILQNNDENIYVVPLSINILTKASEKLPLLSVSASGESMSHKSKQC